MYVRRLQSSEKRKTEKLRCKKMAIDVGTGISAAKKSFLTIGLPMMVGAFVVAFLMAVFAKRVE